MEFTLLSVLHFDFFIVNEVTTKQSVLSVMSWFHILFDSTVYKLFLV